jgi:hypothetical protein
MDPAAFEQLLASIGTMDVDALLSFVESVGEAVSARPDVAERLAVDHDHEHHEPEAIAASAKPPVVSRVAARRPATTAPTTRTRQARITDMAGHSIDESALAETVLGGLQRARYGTGHRGQVLASLHSSVDVDAPRLGRHGDANRAIVASGRRQAILASGGLCVPPGRSYGQKILASTARPVRDGLLSFPAIRGGIRWTNPPIFGDLAEGTAVWTAVNDALPTNPTTKPHVTYECDGEEQELLVSAITQMAKIGVWADRWEPEGVLAFLELLSAEQASLAESTLLSAITAGSQSISHGQLLGAARDIPTAIAQAATQARSRGRMSPTEPFTVILPSWLKEVLRTDLARQPTGDSTMSVKDAQLDELFTVRHLRPIWSIDYQRIGAQGAGALRGWPSAADCLLFNEGGWVHIDGGSLDLGVVRDVESVKTNDLYVFEETFETVAHFSGPSYLLNVDFCANGGVPSALDIAPCVSGS